MKRLLLLFSCLSLAVISYAQRDTKIVESATSNIDNQEVSNKTIKRKVAIGRFSNETSYGKGIFYDKKNDPMGKQALDILSSKLAASEKFILLERSDLETLLAECQKGENVASTIGADYMILGSLTEFGRKNTGKNGVFSNTLTQSVEAGVSIRIVDVSTGLIIYSDEAKGFAEVSSKQTMGIGGQQSFDGTLSDKAISEAIGQLVENIINKCTDKPWRTYFLSYDEDGVLVAGGASQGLSNGDSFAIMTAGKKVKNPQTGVTIELPGKKVGTVTVVMTGGDTPETEFSFVEVNSDVAINSQNMDKFYITE